MMTGEQVNRGIAVSYLPHNTTMAQAAAQLLGGMATPAARIRVCPQISSQVEASMYLVWQELRERSAIHVEDRCRCGLRPNVQLEPSQVTGRRLRMSAARYHDSEKGRTAVLIGNGPSLTTLDLRRFASHVTIGCNKLFLMDRKYRFRPTHYVLEDRLVIEDCAEVLATYRGSVRWLPVDRFGRNVADAYYPLWRSYQSYPQFSLQFLDDVYTGWSVLYVMLQLAVFLGIKRIVLVGVDGIKALPPAEFDGPVATSLGRDTDHFDPAYYGPGSRFHAPEPEKIHAAYSHAAARLAEQGICVVNATPGTAVEAFPRAELGELGI